MENELLRFLLYMARMFVIVGVLCLLVDYRRKSQ